jgi:hypothetical protein
MPQEAKSKFSGSLRDPLPSFFKPGPRFAELHALAKGGNLFALQDAKFLAEDIGYRPHWLISLQERLINGTISGKQPGGQWHKDMNKFKRAMKHFDRWRAVHSARKQGVPWADVFAKASELLKTTTAKGGETAIEASFKKVNKEIKDAKKRHLYYRVSARTRALGGFPIYKP